MGIPPLRVVPVTPGRNWLAACQLTQNGHPIPNLFNVLLALRQDPQWTGKIRFDEMLGSVVLAGAEGPAEDIDAYRIHEWLQTNGLIRVGLDPVREAIEIVGREHCFHPLRERLDGLAGAWDGMGRAVDWVTRFLGADDNEYHRQVGYRFLIAMIARVFEPGCKADYMPVLEGPQGILKSQVIAALAGPYYSDTLPDLGGDAIRLSMHLRGKWLVEVSELSAFSRAESARLKAFLTTRVEQYIPKFARREVAEKRQCLFVGTTNDDTYLKDETGNRRYWPIKCGTIDLDGLRDAVDQILGEAVLEYRRGQPWWVPPDLERQLFAPVQEARVWVDAWEPKVRSYLNGHNQVTLLQVAEEALLFDASRFGLFEQKRLAGLLRQCGWGLKRSKQTRYWERV